jgi:hypothetical protein
MHTRKPGRRRGAAQLPPASRRRSCDSPAPRGRLGTGRQRHNAEGTGSS